MKPSSNRPNTFTSPHFPSYLLKNSIMAQNKAAWLDDKGAPLRVGDAPMQTPGPAEIIVKNHAVAINPLDWHMQDAGLFVKQ